MPPSSSRSGIAHARSFAAFEADPVFEDSTTNDRIGTEVLLGRRSYALLPFVFGIQSGLCHDRFERHEKASSWIRNASSPLKFCDLAGKVLSFIFQV